MVEDCENADEILKAKKERFEKKKKSVKKITPKKEVKRTDKEKENLELC